VCLGIGSGHKAPTICGTTSSTSHPRVNVNYVEREHIESGKTERDVAICPSCLAVMRGVR
jgi:hypothetical protein